MNEEVLIIGKVVGWSGGVPKGLISGWVPALVGDSRRPLFFNSFLRGFFSMLNRFLEVLGGQNGSQNRILGGFFAMFFSSAFWHRFGMHFGRLRTSKNRFSPERGANFHKIGVCDKSLKRAPFRGRFGRSRPSKIDEKSGSKLSLFQTSFHLRFFCVLL